MKGSITGLESLCSFHVGQDIKPSFELELARSLAWILEQYCWKDLETIQGAQRVSLQSKGYENAARVQNIERSLEYPPIF